MNRTSLERLVDRMREHAGPEEPREYRCAACCDTGYVEIADGLEDGRRVCSPTVVACTSIAHQRVRRAEPTAERFS